jgi:hypothetical protein
MLVPATMRLRVAVVESRPQRSLHTFFCVWLSRSITLCLLRRCQFSMIGQYGSIPSGMTLQRRPGEHTVRRFTMMSRLIMIKLQFFCAVGSAITEISDNSSKDNNSEQITQRPMIITSLINIISGIHVAIFLNIHCHRNEVRHHVSTAYRREMVHCSYAPCLVCIQTAKQNQKKTKISTRIVNHKHYATFLTQGPRPP